MTLNDFEQRIRKYSPSIRIRQGQGDVAGVFDGSSYLFRLNKGEIPVFSWKKEVIEGKQPTMKDGILREEPIVKKYRKRGRMQALHLLVNYRYLTPQ